MGTIQIKRGLAANLPASAEIGEILYTSDTKCFYVGNGSGVALTKFENSSQLASYLTAKSNIGHAHSNSEISDFTLGVDNRINLQKGVANGIANLDMSGKIPTSQIPAIFKEAIVVDNISARDALSVFSGMHTLVLDATDDNTVESGGAEYVFNGTSWQKISELNNLDMIVSWDSIQNKPDFIQSFLDLIDTPDTFTGMGGKLIAVKSDLSGLEFVDQLSGNIDGGLF